MARLQLSGLVQQAGQQIAQAGDTFATKLFEAEAFSESTKLAMDLDRMAGEQLLKDQEAINSGGWDVDAAGNQRIGGKTLQERYSANSESYKKMQEYIAKNAKNPKAKQILMGQAADKLSTTANKVSDLIYTARANKVAGDGQVSLMQLVADPTKELQVKLDEGKSIVQGIFARGGWDEGTAAVQLEKFKSQVIYDSLRRAQTQKFVDAVTTKGYNAAMDEFIKTTDYSLTYDGTTVTLSDSDIDNIERRMEARDKLDKGAALDTMWKIMLNAEKPAAQQDQKIEKFDLASIEKYGGDNKSYFLAQYRGNKDESEAVAADGDYLKLMRGTIKEADLKSFSENHPKDNRYDELVRKFADQEENTTLRTVVEGVVAAEASAAGNYTADLGSLGTIKGLKEVYNPKDGTKPLISEAMFLSYSARLNAAAEKIAAKQSDETTAQRVRDILAGKITTLDEAIAGLKADQNISGISNLFLSTIDRKKADARTQLGISAAEKTGDLQTALAKRTLMSADLDDVETWLKTNKNDLGEERFRAYYADVQSVRWKYYDEVDGQLYLDMATAIKANPGKYSDADILAAELSPEKKAQLLSQSAQATQNAALKSVVDKYKVNIQIKMGEDVGDKKPLSLEDLNNKDLTPEAVRIYTELLARDSMENKSIQLFQDVKSGKIKGDAILAAKGVDASFAINLYNSSEAEAKDKAWLPLYEGLKLAEKQAAGGVLTEEEKAKVLTADGVKKSGASETVKQSFMAALDNLSVTDMNIKIDDFRRAAYKDGKIDDAKAAELRSKAKFLPQSSQASTLALIETITQNAEALGLERADRAKREAAQAKQDQRTDAAYAAKDAAELNEKNAKGIFDSFKTYLVSGKMTEDSYDSFYDKIISSFGEDIQSASKWTHEMDLAWGKVQDKALGSKENKAMDAYQELVNTKTVSGYKKTGEVMDMAFIDKIFTGTSREELKVKEYWVAKMQSFTEGHQLIQAEEDAAIIQLQDAKANLFISFEAGKKASGPVLTPELLESLKGKISSAKYQEFSNAMISHAQAVSAAEDVADRKDTIASQGEVEEAKTALSKLSVYAGALAGLGNSFAADTQVTINGVTMALNPNTFEALLGENAATLIRGGLYDDAAKLRYSFAPKTTDPRWNAITTAQKELAKKGTWKAEDDQLVANFISKNPTADGKQVDEFVKFLKTKKVEDFSKDAFNFSMGAFDSSEEWLQRRYSGEFKNFMGSKDGKNYVIFSVFKDKFEKHSAEVFNTFSKAFPKVSLKEGVNVIKEVSDDGDVVYKVTDKNTLKALGVDGAAGTFYLGMYGKDAQLVREYIGADKKRYAEVYLPYEKLSTATTPGRWVSVEFTRGENGAPVARKTQAQMLADNKNGGIETVKDAGFETIYENYPLGL